MPPGVSLGVAPGASVSVAPGASVAPGVSVGVGVGPSVGPSVGPTASARAAPGPNGAPAAELPGAEGMSASGSHWTVTVPAPRTCALGSACPLLVRLDAKDGFHVNEQYPTKLELDASQQYGGLGTTAGKPNVFTKAAGNFAAEGEHGTMTATVKPVERGLAKLAGTLKFSVCAASNCQMGTAQVRATLPVR